jgi:hypothetical protein
VVGNSCTVMGFIIYEKLFTEYYRGLVTMRKSSRRMG